MGKIASEGCYVTFAPCRVKGCPTNGAGPGSLCARHRAEERDAAEGSHGGWPRYVCGETIRDEHGAIVRCGALAMRYIAETIPRPQTDLAEEPDPLALQWIDAERERRRLEEE